MWGLQWTRIPIGQCDCEGNVDADGNGTCDHLEVAGCLDSEACNFLMNLLRLTTVLASTALVNFLPQGVTIWLLSLLPCDSSTQALSLECRAQPSWRQIVGSLRFRRQSFVHSSTVWCLQSCIKWFLECFDTDVVHAFVVPRFGR